MYFTYNYFHFCKRDHARKENNWLIRVPFDRLTAGVLVQMHVVVRVLIVLFPSDISTLFGAGSTLPPLKPTEVH